MSIFIFVLQIIALKTRLTHQESTIQQLHKVRREMEEVFNKEKKILEIEVEEDKQLIKQLELRVDLGRQTIQEAKAAQMQAERDLLQVSFIVNIYLCITNVFYELYFYFR